VPGCVLRARPIGVLHMEDEAGSDEKLICVPHDKVHPMFSGLTDADELPRITRATIEHFFATYKDLESDKWVKVKGWGPASEAADIILKSMAAYQAEAAGKAAE
jgi:inorganic pyrophosphatase